MIKKLLIITVALLFAGSAAYAYKMPKMDKPHGKPVAVKHLKKIKTHFKAHGKNQAWCDQHIRPSLTDIEMADSLRNGLTKKKGKKKEKEKHVKKEVLK